MRRASRALGWVGVGVCLAGGPPALAGPEESPPPDDPATGSSRAALAAEVTPEYPPSARGAEGEVVVEVTVGPDGTPSAVRVLSGPDVFRAAALAAAASLRFSPATDRGRPVASIVPVVFRFAPPAPPPVEPTGPREVVEVHAEDPDLADVHARTTLGPAGLEQVAGDDLAEAVAAIPGVTLSRGSADIAKPIIRGQSERRLLILQDGVRHEGQKWGSDHAPEVDPFSGGSVTVIRGAAGARFGPDAIGGVILVDPPEMRREAGVAGRGSVGGGLNGRRGFGALGVDWVPDGAEAWSFRVEGDGSRSGSLEAPGYVLGNTASRQWNLGASIQHRWRATSVRASWRRHSLHAGVFYGQRASTPDDFRAQVERGEPPGAERWVTDDTVDRPFQDVEHDLGTLRAEGDPAGAWSWSAIYAFQHDRRREYDAVRDADEVGSQYDFTLRTHSADAALEHEPVRIGGAGLGGGFALQGAFQEHVYAGLPLLPNHRSFHAGAGGFERLSWSRLDVEAAGRMDGLSRTAFFGDDEFGVHERRGSLEARDCPADGAVRACPGRWTGASATLGGVLHAVPYRLDLKVEGSTTSRFPSVDEAYLLGAAPTSPVYALGSPDLRTERSIGGSTTVVLQTAALAGEASAFASRIDDYIWFTPALGPSGSPAFDVTVRGTFPRWEFRQVDAVLHGADGRLEAGPESPVSLAVRGALVRARERSTGLFLTGVPPDHAAVELTVRPPGAGPVRRPALSARADAVARQSRVDPSLDFAPPPPGYVLLGAGVAFALLARGSELRVSVEASNLTNVRYREYTSLTRYFADQPGRDVIARLSTDL
jgi:iron complex outermembrane receptor protein